MNYELIDGGGVPIKAWVKGVQFEDHAKAQLRDVANLPCVGKFICAMPDVHAGRGGTIGSVIPTIKAIIPGCVGVDLGCGVMSVRTTLTSHDISDNGKEIEKAIYAAVPARSWGEEKEHSRIPSIVSETWVDIEPQYRKLVEKHGRISSRTAHVQLGTLGFSNHYVSVNIDETDHIHLCLHSGSRNLGNMIGTHFIQLAIKDMEQANGASLPSNKELAYLNEGTEHFNDYVEAMLFAQEYARLNRLVMMENIVRWLKRNVKLNFTIDEEAINVHHNFVKMETHFGEDMWITRKGAIEATAGKLALIPGCMGGKSFIVRGKGNPDSYSSCSHGAGRRLSRTLAKQEISTEQHRKDMGNCIGKTDRSVIDESKSAYKDIDAVMAAQSDLVEVVHTLQEMVSIKS